MDISRDLESLNKAKSKLLGSGVEFVSRDVALYAINVALKFSMYIHQLEQEKTNVRVGVAFESSAAGSGEDTKNTATVSFDHSKHGKRKKGVVRDTREADTGHGGNTEESEGS